MPDSLNKYRSMRRFHETPEPAGAVKPVVGSRPIFVIQKHHATQLHYDFRLEMEGVLKSWAVPRGPSYNPAEKRLAMMTEDHPYEYAAFEGVIPGGNYGAGKVIIWDHGTWELIEGDDPVKAVAAGNLKFRLAGLKMFGEWALVRIKGRSTKGNEWLLIKHRDAYANADVDVTEVAPLSVVSNVDVEEVTAERTWISSRPARTPARYARAGAPTPKSETKEAPKTPSSASSAARGSTSKKAKAPAAAKTSRKSPKSPAKRPQRATR
ncbi:MAG TPA: DNA polymerase ligase N-terminal domain-containing protein [Thermoanaerobaculia bacterium]|nr:DNA polymerase ligase N-terminal domain-containing protein [Thermoanaerobaculia bacterium]